MASGITYLAGPLMAVVARRYQHFRRPMIWVGWLLCETGLVLASFTHSVGGLVWTQGVMYGGKQLRPIEVHRRQSVASMLTVFAMARSRLLCLLLAYC